MEGVGAAKIILDKDLNSEILSSTITEIIKDPDQLAQMAKNAERIAIPNVEDRIYEEIRKVVIKKVTG